MQTPKPWYIGTLRITAASCYKIVVLEARHSAIPCSLYPRDKLHLKLIKSTAEHEK
jgi:hypothetical protein